MSFHAIQSHETSDPSQVRPERALPGILPSLARPGEVEIAGHLYATKARLASILDVSERTLDRWEALRIGPPKIKVGRLVLYDLARVPEWLATLESHPVRAPGRKAAGDRR